MKGHIRQRGKDTWQLIYYAGRKPDGKPDYKGETVHGTRRAAEARMAEIQAAMAKGTHVAPEKQTVAEYLQRWLEEIRPTVREITYTWYEMHCRLHIVPELGRVQLAKLTPLQIQAAYRRMLSAGRTANSYGGQTGGGLSIGSVRGMHRTLRRALNQAVRWGLLARNPIEAVEPPKAKRNEPTTLTPEQAARFLKLAEATTDLHSLYLAALTTGMRLGELLGLRWSDVDLEAGTATIRQTVAKGGASPVFSTPKTARGIRVVTLPPSLTSVLTKDRVRKQMEKDACQGSYNDYDLIWCAANGNPLTARNVDRQFKALLAKAGLPGIRFHDLRHTHATMLLQAGEHPKVVQERLGHGSIQVTMDIYSHVMPTLQREAAAHIDKILFSTPTKARDHTRS